MASSLKPNTKGDSSRKANMALICVKPGLLSLILIKRLIETTRVLIVPRWLGQPNRL